MGNSPVDDLVDGLDAIGSIIDENLPQIREKLAELADRQETGSNDISSLRQSYRDITESLGELRKSDINIDVRLEELSATLGSLSRRLDQIQKSLLDLTEAVNALSLDNELADAVKLIEDRIKRLEGNRLGGTDNLRRF